MKKIILTVLLFLGSVTGLWAQAFLVTPEAPILVTGAADEFELVGYGFVQNNTSEPLTFRWERQVEDLPSNAWRTLVCDAVTCWGPNTNQSDPSDPIIVQPGDMVNLDVHFQMGGEAGNGYVEIYIYAAEDSVNTAMTVVYEAEAWTVGIADEPILADTRLYPNPVRNRLNIDFDARINMDYVEIYNLIGQKVATHDLPFGQNEVAIETDQLDTGMYFITLFDDMGRLVTTKAFSKL